MAPQKIPHPDGFTADALGGPGDVFQNFIPIHRNLNRGRMRDFEEDLRQHILKTNKPHVYIMNPIYDGSVYGPNSPIPDKIQVTVHETVELNGKIVVGTRIDKGILKTRIFENIEGGK